MKPLYAPEILRVWEWGQARHPVDIALNLLSEGLPEMPHDELAALSIGQRDALLLTLREWTFGEVLRSFTDCPQCTEYLEFTIPAERIGERSESEAAERVFEMNAEELGIRFRLPNSIDLAAIAQCEDANSARRQLAQRCVLEASRGTAAVLFEDLGEDVISKLAESLATLDPQAEVLLDIECSACGHKWQMIFDIVTFFWAEICSEAKRLLREVHSLAMAYGWKESDILSMSAIRRHYYLGMLPNA